MTRLAASSTAALFFGEKTIQGSIFWFTHASVFGQGGGADLKYADVLISNAELKAIRATPKTLVPAPGTGKVLEFLSAVVVLAAGTNVLTEATANLAVKYQNGAGVQVSQTVEMTGFIDQAAHQVTYAIPKIDPITARTACENQPLVLHNLGAGEFAGNAANDATLRVKVAYRVHTADHGRRGIRRRRAGHAPGGCRESGHRRARRWIPGSQRPKLVGGEEWPEQPSLRFLVHWALRRDELCDPKLCPDAPDDGDRCDHCPLDRLDSAQSSEPGLLIRRALDLRAALKLGIHLGLDDIRADEFYAMLILEEEREQLDRENLPGSGNHRI